MTPCTLRPAVWLGLLLFALVGCGGEPASSKAGGAAEGDAQDHDRLVIGITQYPSTLHPLIENMTAKSYVHGMSLRSLVRIGYDWTLECALCVELPTLENGGAVLETTPDGEPGVAVSFELIEGLSWGDGTPMTSADLRFAWEIGRDPRSGALGAELWRSIYAFDVIDTRRFVLHSDRRTFAYNAPLALSPVPEHLEREIFEAAPAEYQNRTLYQTDPTNPGLWLGPYRVTGIAPGSHVDLARHAHWSGRPTAFDEIRVRTIERTTTLEANLLSGEIDMVPAELGFSLDQVLAFQRRHGDDFDIEISPGLAYEHIDLRLANPILADIRVRRALLHAVDRQQLVDELFGGQQSVAHSFVHPLDPMYSADVRHYRHDPERAAALLEEAGWSMAPDGIRRNAAGEPLQLEIVTTAGNKSRELVEQVLQSQWRASGIDVRIRNEAPRIFFAETLSKMELEAMGLYAWVNVPEPVPRTVLMASEIPSEANGWSGNNFTGYSNPEMDELIVAIEDALDPEERARHWARVQALYAEDLPVLPLFFRSAGQVVPKWLAGVRQTGHLYNSTEWIEDWSVVE